MISSQFIQSCQSGDEAAIQTLVRTYQRSVFQLALSIIDDGQEVKPESETYLGITAEAEAATRQTFIHAIDRMGRYREGTNFETWLYGIAIQVSRQHARNWKTRQRFRGLVRRTWERITRGNAREQADLDELKSAPLLRAAITDREKDLPAAKDPLGDKTATADPRSHAGDLELWSAVRQLEEKLRVPVVLRYYHDFPIGEIAHLLHISEGTVHARLDAAREKIARIKS